MKKTPTKSSAKPNLNEASSRVVHVTFQLDKEAMFRNYVTYLTNPWKMFWSNLILGAARGLGFVLGSTILLAIFVYTTTQILANLPFFSDFGQAVNIWLEDTLDRS